MLGLSDDDLVALVGALPGRTIVAVYALDSTRYAVISPEPAWYVTRLDGLYAVLDRHDGLLAEARTLEEALTVRRESH